MLRTGLLAAGALAAAAGILLAWLSHPAWAWLAVTGIVIVLGVGLERAGYRRRPVATSGWEPTEERFVDPTTGRMTRVEFNPATGERRYLDAGDSDAPV